MHDVLLGGGDGAAVDLAGLDSDEKDAMLQSLLREVHNTH